MYTSNSKNLPTTNVSTSKDAKVLTKISLVNIDSKKANKVEIDFNALGIKTVTGSILASSKLQDYNIFENVLNLKMR